MKPLISVPSLKQLNSAYSQLQTNQLGSEKLVNISQWCRFDARLSELWLSYFHRNLEKINPIEFNRLLRCTPWPAAALPILEFLPSIVEDEKKPLARALLKLYSLGVRPAQNEMYYFDLSRMKIHWQLAEVKASLKPFLKWGYFSKEAPINKFNLTNERITYKKLASRRQVLDSLCAKNKKITVEMYMNALDHSVSRRIAQLDLQNHPKLKASGHTRSLIYTVRSSIN